MPYVTEWQEPEIYLQHKGVTVYRTYVDNELEQGCRTYWFTLNAEDFEQEDEFDVRDLQPTWRKLGSLETDARIKETLRVSIERGKLPGQKDN